MARRPKVYVPVAEKVAVVLFAWALAKVTLPDPPTLLQVVVTAPGGLGSPSSVTVPPSTALLGKTMVSSGPALTTGAVLVGVAVGVVVLGEGAVTSNILPST